MAANPQAMQELMDSPAIRSYIDSIVANPESVRAMMESQPPESISKSYDSNPELRHLFNDPETLLTGRFFFFFFSLMREQMRQHDRMFANVEAHPEGFNALARAYTDVQAPMMNAMASGRDGGAGNTAGGAQADNPFAGCFGPQTTEPRPLPPPPPRRGGG